MQKYLKIKDKHKNLKFRNAKNKDLLFVLKLHNENVKSKKTFSKNIVKLKEHKTWFKKKIKDKMLFIFELDEQVGYIRYDYIDRKNLSISITTKKKYRRKGLGKKMLDYTLKRKKISKFNIIAYVKNNNITSKKFFLDSGFRLKKLNTYVLKKKYEKIYK